MRSVILTTATKYLMPMLLLLSAFLLLRGHNLPGGGFVGGLVASTTFILHSFAFDAKQTRRMLRVSPHHLVAIGLLLAGGSGLLGPFKGLPFMSGTWGDLPVGGSEGHLAIGTPVLFDVGVYLVVLGSTLIVMLSLAEGEN